MGTSLHFIHCRDSLKQTFIAAYPVLMPVYLLQYENGWEAEVGAGVDVEGELRNNFVIVDASTKPPGLVATGNILQNVVARIRAPNATSDAGFEKLRSGMARLPLWSFRRDRLRSLFISPWVKLDRLLVLPHNAVRERRIESVINTFGSLISTWKRYMNYDIRLRKKATGSEDIDWTDPRIRAYSEEETKAVEMYRAAQAEHMMLRDMVSTLANVNSDVASSSSESHEPSPRVAKFKEVLKLIEQTKPEWVKSWEAQHKEEAADEGKASEEEREAQAELEREARAKVGKEQAGGAA